MSNFKKLFNEHMSFLANEEGSILSEALPPTDPSQQGGQPPAPAGTGPESVQPQTPAPQEVKEPQADITSEGKKFLVELARQALAVDPDNITATDKDLFNIEITTENADEILQRIQSIVDLYG